jgi:hypothetical protein
LFWECACIQSSLVSVPRRSASEWLSADWRLPSARSGIGLMSLLARDSGWWDGVGDDTDRRQKYTFANLALIIAPSRLTRSVRGSVFGTMPAEHSFSLVQRLSGTDQGVECPERSIE